MFKTTIVLDDNLSKGSDEVGDQGKSRAFGYVDKLAQRRASYLINNYFIAFRLEFSRSSKHNGSQSALF